MDYGVPEEVFYTMHHKDELAGDALVTDEEEYLEEEVYQPVGEFSSEIEETMAKFLENIDMPELFPVFRDEEVFLEELQKMDSSMITLMLHRHVKMSLIVRFVEKFNFWKSFGFKNLKPKQTYHLRDIFKDNPAFLNDRVLTEGRRNDLISKVVNYFVSGQIAFTAAIRQSLAKQIASHFQGEYEHYYADDGLRNCGADKLYLRHRETIFKRLATRTPSTPVSAQKTLRIKTDSPQVTVTPNTALPRKRSLETAVRVTSNTPVKREPMEKQNKKVFVIQQVEQENPEQMIIEQETPVRSPVKARPPKRSLGSSPGTPSTPLVVKKKVATKDVKKEIVLTSGGDQSVQFFNDEYLAAFAPQRVIRWVRDGPIFGIRFINYVKKNHPAVSKGYVEGFDLNKCRLPLSLYLLPAILEKQESVLLLNSFISVCNTEAALVETCCAESSDAPRVAIIGTLYKPEMFMVYHRGEVFHCKAINNAMDVAMDQFLTHKIPFPKDTAAAWQFMFVYFWNHTEHMNFVYSPVTELIAALNPCKASLG